MTIAAQEALTLDKSLSTRMKLLVALFRTKCSTSQDLKSDIEDFLTSLELLIGEIPKHKQLELYGQLKIGFDEAG